MTRSHMRLLLALAATSSVRAQILRGKVVMPDSTAPTQRVYIERVCPGVGAYGEAVTNKHGEYWFHPAINAIGVTQSRASNTSVYHCILRARLKGFESNGIDLNDPKVLGNPVLPLLTLRPVAAGKSGDTGLLPKSVLKSWESGARALEAEQWVEAERLLRDVTRAAPQFAPAWTGLGMAAQNQQRPDEARQFYQRAVSLDAAALQPCLFLTRLEISSQRWPEAAASAEALIAVDANRRYPEAYLAHAIARYQLHQLDPAHASLIEAIRLDTRRQLPQAEYFLGAVLAGKGGRAAAAEHLRTYLDLAPNAPSADLVRRQIEELSRATAAAQFTLEAPRAILANTLPEPEIVATGEAWVPGGRQALAAVAHMKSVPSPQEFFAEYARTVAAQTSRLNEAPIPGYASNLIAFVTSVAALTELGDRRPDRTVLHLSLAPADRPRTERILAALGWRVTDRDGKPAVEPGDQPVDGPRQQVPRALGIDELSMDAALEAGHTFDFEIFTENAILAGGAAWGSTLEGFTTLPGGIAEAFVRQPRLARTYAGLAAMGPADGLTFARRAGLRVLIATHADALWLYGDSFRVFSNQAVVPGGPAAEELWTKLAGTSPRDAAKFFQSLLAVDHGRLAAFFSVLSHADLAHRMFFTRDIPTAQRYYAWYRDSEELREGIGVPQRVWRPAFFQKLPLDNLFPGGRTAWSQAASDDDALLALDQEALLAAARLKNLPPESARLFARYFNDWRGILPYFEALPALGPAEFQALADFTATAPRNDVMGEWHSLIALLLHRRKTGGLDDAAAAREFGQICRTLAAPTHKPADLARLTSQVYETLLPSDTLLLNEDPGLPSRHVFALPKQPLFQPAALVASTAPGGSHFSGGFAGFEELGRKLARIGDLAQAPASAPSAALSAPMPASSKLTPLSPTSAAATSTVSPPPISSSVRPPSPRHRCLRRWRRAHLLRPPARYLAEHGCRRPRAEKRRPETDRRPPPKRHRRRLQSERGDLAAPAVHHHRVAATRAVLRVELGDRTALDHGLIRVNRDLSRVPRPQVIVVFTDGEDNASTLPAATATSAPRPPACPSTPSPRATPSAIASC